MKRFWIMLVTTAALLATPSLAHAACLPRPDGVPPALVITGFAPPPIPGYNDYATPGYVFFSRWSDVHYVVSGIDAPPLNDDSGDGVPDYVERVGAAADSAIVYFERRGFVSIRPDQGGPDARPDIYIARLTPGYLGVSVTAVDACGGAFTVVSNSLDPSPERSFGSLYGTVAHEVFHLVQFSYFPPTVRPPLPDWVLEGSASAIENSVDPELDDIASSRLIKHWLRAPQRSLTKQRYAAQLFWGYLEERALRVLPRFLASVGISPPRRYAARLATVFTHVTRLAFAPAFGDFATWVAENYDPRVTPLQRGRARRRIAPLAMNYIPLPHGTRTVKIRFRGGRGEAQLTYEIESKYAGDAPISHRLRARPDRGQFVITIPPKLRRHPRFGHLRLVLANGDVSRITTYSLRVM